MELANSMATSAIGRSGFAELPNKPVLPTASTSHNHYAPGPLRRQTGQPLGSAAGNEQRATEEQNVGHVR